MSESSLDELEHETDASSAELDDGAPDSALCSEVIVLLVVVPAAHATGGDHDELKLLRVEQSQNGRPASPVLGRRVGEQVDHAVPLQRLGRSLDSGHRLLRTVATSASSQPTHQLHHASLVIRHGHWTDARVVVWHQHKVPHRLRHLVGPDDAGDMASDGADDFAHRAGRVNHEGHVDAPLH